jgi:hypothetical protein
VDLTQEEYKKSPDRIKIGVQRRQVVGLVSEKKVIEFTISLYENILPKEKSPVIFPEGVNAPVQFSPELKTRPYILEILSTSLMKRYPNYFLTFITFPYVRQQLKIWLKWWRTRRYWILC